MSSELVEYLSSFVSARRLDTFEKVLGYRTRYISIVCEDIYQNHNASAVLRTCECFGIQDIHIIEQRNSFEINSEIALGASNWLTLHRYVESSDPSGVIKNLRSKGYRIVATTPQQGTKLSDFDIGKGPVSIVFGTEKDGLSPVIERLADEFVSIDMYGFTKSFNVSVSAGIILHFMRLKLMQSGINWQLTEQEKLQLKLEWLRKTVKHSHIIEKGFFDSGRDIKA